MHSLVLFTKVRLPSTRGDASPRLRADRATGDEPHDMFFLPTIIAMLIACFCAPEVHGGFGAGCASSVNGSSSLASIAEQTKINVAPLEALERDDVSHWPSGFSAAPSSAPMRGLLRRARRHVAVLGVTRTQTKSSRRSPGARSTRPNPKEGPPIRLRIRRLRRRLSLTPLMGAAGTRPAVAESAVAVASHLSRVTSVSESLTRRLRTAIRSSEPRPDSGRAVHATAAAVSTAPTNPTCWPPHLRTELAGFTNRARPNCCFSAVSILDAVGVIVWAWDAQNGTEAGARPRLFRKLAQLRVREADNATAAAFRSTQTCIVNGSEMGSGAGCRSADDGERVCRSVRGRTAHGIERALRAIATIFAFAPASLIGTARLPQAVNA